MKKVLPQLMLLFPILGYCSDIEIDCAVRPSMKAPPPSPSNYAFDLELRDTIQDAIRDFDQRQATEIKEFTEYVQFNFFGEPKDMAKYHRQMEAGLAKTREHYIKLAIENFKKKKGIKK